jgi:hypothetical protein
MALSATGMISEPVVTPTISSFSITCFSVVILEVCQATQV